MQYTATVETNEKYHAVINGETDFPAPDTEEEWREQHPAPDAADAYLETIDNAPTGDPDVEYPELTWAAVNVASDPELLATLATYFDGIDPDEPHDLIAAKLRLVDVDLYVAAQIAAQAEMGTYWEQSPPA